MAADAVAAMLGVLFVWAATAVLYAIIEAVGAVADAVSRYLARRRRHRPYRGGF